jgi:signal transduction histidine kinase
LPFFAALLPIVLLSVYAFSIASSSVQTLVESANVTASANLSQLVTQDITHMVTLAHAVAAVPGTVDAAVQRDDLTMNIRLKALVLAYPQIERAFITDGSGTLWSDYPPVPGSYGVSQTQTEWYRGLSADWQPYVSNVYIPFAGARSPAVAISVPIQNGNGSMIGALVLEYRTDQITRWLENIHLGTSGYLYVVDQKGILVAHPSLQAADHLYDIYADILQIQEAQTQGFSSGEYVDPLNGKRTIASFQSLSVGKNTWVIVAGQPTDEAYQPLNNVKFRIRMAGGLLTLVTLGMVLALALSSMRNQRLSRALASKNQTLQDITSFVSHQLRAPVTAMRWTIEEMLDGDYAPVPPKLIEPLTSLKDVAIQNGNLINDILNVSRIDRGVIEVTNEQVQLRDIVERALRDYRIALEKAGLSLHLKNQAADILVLADKEKMAEAVTNAISNAIKHTKKGGITIAIRTDDRYGYIDVTDTGEGMSQEMMDKLFNRSGVSGSNTDSALSTGLGLYIARNFMHLQKGDITVTSTVGKGSTFTYSVPLANSLLPSS